MDRPIIHRDCPGLIESVHRSIPIGPKILIPGYPQWSWKQRDRALVLFGSYLTAILVGGVTWGSPIGLLVLGFAFATHVYSAVDAIRQNAFPAFGWSVPTFTASASLGVVFYAPALALASVYAWPIALDDHSHEAYLVNRWAYRDEVPRAGQTVWLKSKRGLRPKVARILATPGQRIEWVGGELRVDDQLTQSPLFAASETPSVLKLMIPEGHVLVDFATDSGQKNRQGGNWEIVDSGEIRGRAWARSFPIWDRRLLP